MLGALSGLAGGARAMAVTVAPAADRLPRTAMLFQALLLVRLYENVFVPNASSSWKRPLSKILFGAATSGGKRLALSLGLMPALAMALKVPKAPPCEDFSGSRALGLAKAQVRKTVVG